jgi:hypothetical protein
MNVVKFPYNASRRFYSRRPRKSINGTPEERAAKTAADAAKIVPAGIVELSVQGAAARPTAKRGGLLALQRAEARPIVKRDGRKLRGNPLRLKFAPISSAVTIARKMHTMALRDEPLSILHPDIRQKWVGELRAGADSARIVANELDHAAEHLSKVRSVSKAAAKSQAADIIDISERDAGPLVLSSDEFVAQMACLDQDGRQFIIDYLNLLLAKRSS